MAKPSDNADDRGWSTFTSCLLLDRPNLCGRHIGRLPSLDVLDADADHTGGSSYYLSRRRRPSVRP